jgi:hypothetical protein
VKALIQSMPDAKEAEKLKKQTPLFRFYDPAGKPLDDLSGKRASSKSAFSGRIEKLWNMSFEMALKDYAGQMSEILARMDKVATEQQRVTDQLTRAEGNAQKVAALQKEAEALKTEENTINQDEQKILASVKVRAEFAPGGDEKACK